MRILRWCLLTAAACGLAFSAAAANVQSDGVAEGAPQELAHWSSMIGQWAITSESLRPDGSAWDPGPNADWDFYWSFDGWGIQDYWVSPPKSEAVEDESKRQRGINLRTYQPEDQQWVMTWLTPMSKKPQNFTASSDGESIVMRGSELNPQGYHTRITFFDMQSDSFEWKMEWSKDEESWREVFRIHGTRK